jgi:hypothetical protein
LKVKGEIKDVDARGRPREVAEIIVALGAAGVFTAMVEAFKVWLEKDKVINVEMQTSKGTVKIDKATAAAANELIRQLL